jgi:hypothetical protein
MMKGICAATDQQRAHEVSVQPTTMTPQIGRPLPPLVFPVMMSQAPIPPQHRHGRQDDAAHRVSAASKIGAPTPRQ